MREWSHYSTWEDWRAGLYARCFPDERRAVRSAVTMLGSTAVGPMMKDVVVRWPVAAAVNLTNPSRNHRAWVGQATCCYFAGVPEYLTKRAWWELDSTCRDRADARADDAIALWTIAREPQLELLRCQSVT